ncbi:aspartic peptidase domain-containing protein, partial [Gymnopilus junonius]
DSSFLGSLSIGTPPQTFTVVLDSGSSDLWLASSSCTNCNTNAPLFQSDKSQSFQASTGADAEVTITYGSGSVTGIVATDTVTMGGFTVSSQTFLTATSTQNLLQGAISGLIGLAFPPLSQTRSTPFWLALLNANEFSAPDMGFLLARAPASSNAAEVPGGVFTLGGANASLYSGDIEFLDLPVSTPSFWFQSLSAVTVNGQSIQIDTSSASTLSAIDTGTTLIVGPPTDVAAIWAAVPNSSPSRISSGFFRFPCTTQVNVTLSFGGKIWPISPQDMNVGQETPQSQFCLGGIITVGSTGSGSGAPQWIIGDTFLKNVYTVLRASPPSVGFAELSTLAGGTGAASLRVVYQCLRSIDRHK